MRVENGRGFCKRFGPSETGASGGGGKYCRLERGRDDPELVDAIELVKDCDRAWDSLGVIELRPS